MLKRFNTELVGWEPSVVVAPYNQTRAITHCQTCFHTAEERAGRTHYPAVFGNGNKTGASLYLI